MLSIRYKPSMPVSLEVGVIVLTAPPGDFIPSLPLRLSQCLLYRVKRLCVLSIQTFDYFVERKADSLGEQRKERKHLLIALLISFKSEGRKLLDQSKEQAEKRKQKISM